MSALRGRDIATPGPKGYARDMPGDMPDLADVGPCALCAEPTVRYGERGHPHCLECQGRKAAL